MLADKREASLGLENCDSLGKGLMAEELWKWDLAKISAARPELSFVVTRQAPFCHPHV